MPMRTFGAPHTICTSSLPVNTRADVEFLGVRMFRDGANFANDDALQSGTGTLDAFNLETGHRERVRERRHVIASLDPIVQPVQADSHENGY